jgi:hypothetical protein
VLDDDFTDLLEDIALALLLDLDETSSSESFAEVDESLPQAIKSNESKKRNKQFHDRHQSSNGLEGFSLF